MELTFVKKSSLRKIFIKDRVMTLITPELNYQPLSLSITQLKTALASGDKRIEDAIKEAGVDDLDKYVDDETMAKEIIKDFQEHNWRCVKR